MRRAYTVEPQPTVHHPRRYALAPRVAIAAGCALITLALALAAHAVLRAPVTAPGTALAAAPQGTASPGGTDGGGPGGRQAGVSPVPGAQKVPAGEVTVHVTGAVGNPSVQRLPAGSRVADAVAAAGGASPEADTQSLNLARVLNDGEQVRVPKVGESPPAAPAGAEGSQTGAGPGAGAAPGGGPAGKVNVNTAEASALETLPGIGPTLAKRIIAYRNEHGPFATVEDLTDVPGIGPAVLEGLRQEATT